MWVCIVCRIVLWGAPFSLTSELCAPRFRISLPIRSVALSWRLAARSPACAATPARDATALAAVARRRRTPGARSCVSSIRTASQRRTGSACLPATSRTPPLGRCCWRCTAGACHTSPSRVGTNTGARTATSSSRRRAFLRAWAQAGTAPAALVPQAGTEPPAPVRTRRPLSATRRAGSAATAAGGPLATTRSVRSRRCSMKSWDFGARTLPVASRRRRRRRRRRRCRVYASGLACNHLSWRRQCYTPRCIARAAVYATGLSNGGGFLFELARDQRTAGRIAAYFPTNGPPLPQTAHPCPTSASACRHAQGCALQCRTL